MMISVRDLVMRLPSGGRALTILDGVSLEVAAGEVVAVTGPSGSGKSTLLGLIAGLDTPSGGSIAVDGVNVTALGEADLARFRRDTIGFVFQSYHLLDDMTVYENLEVPLTYRNIRRAERQGMVAEVLDRFQIVGKKDLYPNQLSGGQQQLVAVARAVIADPKVILADEPTGNLHSSQGKEIMELFKKLNDKGATIVQVTHSDVNASYGRRIVKLSDGWIVE